MAIKFKGKFGPITGAMRAGDFVAAGDPFAANVETLLHFDNTLTDEYGPSWSAVNGATFTTDSKFGTHAGSFTTGSGNPATDNAALVTEDNNLWNIGIGGESFTVELSIKQTSSAGWKTLMGKGHSVSEWTAASGYMWYIGQADGAMHFHYFNGAPVTTSNGGSIPINTYSHLAAVNNSDDNTFRLYIDGVSVYQTTAITIVKPTTSARNTIGDVQYAHNMNASVDEVRVTKGIARYSGASFAVPTSAFLPASTTPATVTSSGLILDLDASNASSYPGSGTTWTDLQGNYNATLTNTTFDAADGGSIDFNGSSSKGSLGTVFLNDMTAGAVEVWFKPTATPTASAEEWQFPTLINKGNVYASVMILNNYKIRMYRFAEFGPMEDRYYDSAGTATLNAWNQVIYTWDASGSDIYINGQLDTHSTKTWTNVDAGRIGADSTIGSNPSASSTPYFDGLIPIVRSYNKLLTSTEATLNFEATKGAYGL